MLRAWSTFGPMIGVFGGTFDPVHFGHLRPALELLQDIPLDEVRLIPCRLPPHREPAQASPELRRRMVEAAIDGVAGLRLDDRELHREGPSYMVDTLASLRAELGEQVPLCLLLGMDAFAELDQWHRWETLPELAHLVVAERPGWPEPEQGPVARLMAERQVQAGTHLKHRAAGCVLRCPVTRLEISATQIRALTAEGKSTRYLLPRVVEQIIAEDRPYGP